MISQPPRPPPPAAARRSAALGMITIAASRNAMTRNGKATARTRAGSCARRRRWRSGRRTTISSDSSLGMWVSAVERERAADAVDREPADAGDDRVEPGRQGVAEVAERDPGQDHLRYAGPRARGRRAPPWVRLPSAVPSTMARIAIGRTTGRRSSTAMHADEDGGELHVGRDPGQEQLDRVAVPLGQRDELGAAGLDGDDRVAVRAFADLTGDGEGVRASLDGCHSAYSQDVRRGWERGRAWWATEGVRACRRGR